VLAVSVLGSCGDDKTPTTSDPTQPVTSSTAEPTTSSTGTTTAPTSTGVTTTGATDTGGVPECSMYGAEAPCTAEPGCFWFAELGQCIVDCPQIKDQVTCEMQDFCEWFENQCSLLLV
jgi:hypothetical protein